MTESDGLITIIEYISAKFFGTEEYPAPVYITFYAIDTDDTHWVINTEEIEVNFDEYNALNTFVENQGYKMRIGPGEIILRQGGLIK